MGDSRDSGAARLNPDVRLWGLAANTRCFAATIVAGLSIRVVCGAALRGRHDTLLASIDGFVQAFRRAPPSMRIIRLDCEPAAAAGATACMAAGVMAEHGSGEEIPGHAANRRLISFFCRCRR